MKLRFFLLLFCFGLSAHALTLEQALQSGLQNSEDLKSLRLEDESAGWSVTKARSGFLPKLELDGRHLFDEKFEEIEVPFGGSTFVMPAIQPYSALGVTATYKLFDGFRNLNKLDAAHAEKKAAEFKLRRAEDQKYIEIRNLYYRTLASQNLIQVADRNIESLQKHLSDVTIRVKNGVSTRYDSLRVEVQLEDAKTEKLAAENFAAVSRAKLFDAISAADDGHPLEGAIPTDFADIDLSKIQMQSELRTDRAAMIAHQESLEHLKSASLHHWMPAISLFGTYETYNNINHSVFESDSRFKTAYQVGFKLNWNLFDGGADYAAQRQASINSQVSQLGLTKFDQNQKTEFEEIKRRFEYNVAIYKAKLVSIKKAEEAVRLAEGGLKAGTRTNTEILDAVVDLNRTRAAAIRSQADAIEALGQLELSLGRRL